MRAPLEPRGSGGGLARRRRPHATARALPAALLAALPALAACGPEGAAAGPGPAVVRDFVARSTPVRCAPIADPGGNGAAVADLVAADDSTLVALWAGERRLALLVPARGAAPGLRVLADVRLEREGPGSVQAPTSAAAAGDRLYVSDQTRRRIVRLDRRGGDRGAIELPFPPRLVRAGAGRVWATPLAMGLPPDGRLLYQVDAAGASAPFPAPRAIAIAPVRHPDPRVEALANLVEAVPFADGGVVVAHQLVHARAFLVDRAGAVAPAAVPVAEGIAGAVDRAPDPAAFDDEEAAARIATPVLGASPDPRRNEVLLLTKSGRRRGTGTEKAIVRAGRDLRYRGSALLDVNAQVMAWLPALDRAVAVDDEGRWHACPVP